MQSFLLCCLNLCGMLSGPIAVALQGSSRPSAGSLGQTFLFHRYKHICSAKRGDSGAGWYHTEEQLGHNH